jgi:hypothetical protein
LKNPIGMETQAASAHDDTKALCVLVSLVSYKVPEEGDLGDVRDYKLFVLLALLPLPVEEPKQELGQDGHPPKRMCTLDERWLPATDCEDASQRPTLPGKQPESGIAVR